MATPTHTPHGRGFDTALCYFHHGNSYWVQGTGDKTCPVGVDLWDAQVRVFFGSFLGGTSFLCSAGVLDAQEGAAHSIWNSSGCQSKPGLDCDSNYEEVYFRTRCASGRFC
jgi:hypothetical protein